MSFADDVINNNYSSNNNYTNRKKKKSNSFADMVVNNEVQDVLTPYILSSQQKQQEELLKQQQEQQNQEQYQDGDFLNSVKNFLISAYTQMNPILNVIDKSKMVYNKVNESGFVDNFFKESEGNAVQTILGSTADLGLGYLEGILNTGEGLGDTITYARAGVNKWLGNEEKANQLKQEASENAVDLTLNVLKDKTGIERNSIFGSTSDAIAQGVGNASVMMALGSLGASAGLGQVGQTALTQGTMFASSFGSGVSEAYQNGATDDEAYLYGTINATAETLSEMLFGGIGGKVSNIGVGKGLIEADDMLAKKVTENIKNKLVKNIMQYGIKAGAEGTEEVIAGIIEAAGKKLTYMSEEDLGKLLEDEKLLDQFLTGAISSGITQASKLYTTTSKGQDFITGYTDSEQKAFDKLLDEKIKEAQSNSETPLTAKEKGKITKDVKYEFEHGAVGGDRIFDALGYNDVYNDVVSSTEDSLGRPLNAQELEEVKKEVDEQFANTITKNDSVIMRNLYEDELRTQKYTVDLDKVDADTRKFYETQMQEGQADNSTKTHNWMDTMAQFYKDKGLMSHLITEEQAKKELINKAIDEYMKKNKLSSLTGEQRQQLEQKYAEKYKNKTVNGFMKNGELYVNLNSKNALETIVGHEITHILEKNTDTYNVLQKTLQEYVESTGQKYEDLLEKTGGNYKDENGNIIANADTTKELTADLVGEYIFTSQEYINSLAQNRNLFQKIFDEIKYLAKQVTAGSQEQRKLNKAVKMFEKAYRQMSVNIADKQASTIDKAIKQDARKESMRKNSNNPEFFNKSYEDMKKVIVVGSHESLKAIKDGKDTFKFTVDGTEYTAKITDADTNAFEITDVNENNPTENPDIKFSLSETGEMVDNNGNKVELDASNTGNTGTLMAIHNLNEKKLNGVLDLGGFPVPSIAITNTNNVGNNNFGDISVIFDKNTINPEIKENEVYDRDVWTPTFPRVEYNVDNSELRKFAKENNFYDDTNDEIISSVRNHYLYSENVADVINSYGIDGLLDKMKNDSELKYLFLKTKDNNYKPQMKPAKYSRDYDNQTLKDYVEMYNKNKFNDMDLKDFYYHYLNYQDMNLTEDQRNALKSTIRDFVYKEAQQKANEKYNEYKEKGHDFGDTTKEKFINGYTDLLMENYDNSYFKYQEFVRDASILDEYGDRQVIDRSNTLKQVEQDVSQFQFENWVDDTFGKMLNKLEKGIRNDVDLFTPSGYRRDFDKLHDKYTLENVVKLMTKQKTVAGEEGFGSGSGFGTLQAQMSNKFNSIDEIRDYANNKIVPGTQEKELLKPYEEAIYSDMEDLVDYYKYKDDKYTYPMDTVGYALNEFASKNKQDIANLKKILNEYDFDVDNIPSDLINKTVDDVNSLKNIPTDYFEAKPQRAVGLDEIQQVVIPSNASQELRDRLQEMGIPFTEYNPEVEGDKNRVINQFDDLKWSISQQNEIAPVKNPNLTYGEDIAYKGDIAPTGIDYSIKDNDIMDLIHQEVARKNGKKVELTKPVIAKEKSGARTTIDTLRVMGTNEFAEISNMAKDYNNPALIHKADMLNNVAGEVKNSFTTAQTDFNGNEIGEALDKIFDDAKAEGMDTILNDFLLHWSNIDRHKRGKGSQTPLDVSERIVANYTEKYPQLMKLAERVWQYGRNELKNKYDAGMISKGIYEANLEAYPHYVPFISDSNNIDKAFNDLKELKVSPIKRAKGGAGELTPVHEALARYTYSGRLAYRNNELYKEIYKTLNPGTTDIKGAEVGDDFFNGNETLYKNDDGYFLTAIDNGEERKTKISKELYETLNRDMRNNVKNIEEKLNPILKPVQKFSELRRKILTTWNPVFLVKNVVKDIQDGLLNSKHTEGLVKYYAPGIKELFTDSTPEVRQFKALYGTDALRGQYDDADLRPKKGLRNNKFIKGLINANEIMELAPRYAEFKASLEAGESLEQAMYNAREVTTNFARGGVITKALNRNGFTFLNASVQGFDKFIRNFSGENGAKGIVSSLLKALMFGVVPAVFNELVFGAGDDKDEEYDALPDYVKDNYYLIKTGDGNFVRIPKGRALSVFGSAARRTIELAEGEEDAFKGYLSNVNNQIGINNPEENNIFAPLIQAYGSKNGTAWYGGDIVPTRLQDKPKGEQYDASTDKMSIWLGEHLGISPYKLNYVIDQYSGGVGDILLPMITDEAKSNGNIFAPVYDQFVVDSVTDNKYVSDFYTKNDELKVQANSSKATDEDYLRSEYTKHISKEMSKLYTERREIQSDNSLTKAQKYEKSQAIKNQINQLAKTGLDSYDNVSVTGNYAHVGDDMGYYKNAKGNWTAIDQKDIIATESLGLNNREMSSYYTVKNDMYNIDQKYESQLKNATDEQKTELNAQKKVDIINSIKNADLPDSAKAVLYDKKYASTETLNAVLDCNIDFNSYLDLQAQNFTADKDRYGKTINGSKKRKVYSYINSMNMPYEQKIMLAKLEYKSDDTYNREIISYLNNDDSISYQDMTEILKAMGFKVDEYGNITWE